MRLNADLVLRKVGSRYLIADCNTGKVDMAHVFCLNDTAAWLWTRIGKAEFTPEMLVEWLCDEYDVPAAAARKDVDALLETWKKQGLAVV